MDKIPAIYGEGWIRVHLVAKAVLHNTLDHDVSAHARLCWGWEMADIGAIAAMMISPITQLGAISAATDGVKAIETVEEIHDGWLLLHDGTGIAHTAFKQIHPKGKPVKAGKSVAIHKEGPIAQVSQPSSIAGHFHKETVWIGITDETASRAVAFKSEHHIEWTIDEEGVLSEKGDRHPWIANTADPKDAGQDVPADTDEVVPAVDDAPVAEPEPAVAGEKQ